MEATKNTYAAPTLKLLTVNAGSIVCASQRVTISKYDEDVLELD